MVLTIPFEELNDDIKAYYAAGEIKGIGIDYQYNALLGYANGVEVEVYNFDKFFRTDNRYSSYEIYCGPTQILLEFSC